MSITGDLITWEKKGVWQKNSWHVEVESEKEGRQEPATGGLIDSQSVKTKYNGGSDRGYDGGKKVNGRKRHFMVDTLGLVITVIVNAANLADSTSARMVVTDAHLSEPTLEHIWADQGYRGATLQQIADGCSTEQSFRANVMVIFRTSPSQGVQRSSAANNPVS